MASGSAKSNSAKVQYNITKKSLDKQEKTLSSSHVVLPSTKCNKLESAVPIKLVTNIINNRTLELLKIINAKYPDKFPKKAINEEYDYIVEQIEFKPQPMELDCKNDQEKALIKQMGKTRVNVVISKEDRCEGRIWDNIYDRLTKSEVNNIDNSFKVSDYNDIDIKKFAKKYIIGRQCARKKKTDNKYCYQHCRHNPHGNYLAVPDKELCYHYLIDGKYI
jgi:hypothetical protein